MQCFLPPSLSPPPCSTITGKFDAIWDRGSLVAVNPCDRERLVTIAEIYALLMLRATLRPLLKPLALRKE